MGGKDCYIMHISFDPPVGGVSGGIYYYEKDSWLPIRMQLNHELKGSSYSSVTDLSYKTLEGFPLTPPLKVGDEWKCETKATSYTVGGPYEQQRSEVVAISVMRVEKMEEIGVPAGKFNCYKISSYDKSGKVLKTNWFSEEAKNNVKVINHKSGITMKLISYSPV